MFGDILKRGYNFVANTIKNPKPFLNNVLKTVGNIGRGISKGIDVAKKVGEVVKRIPVIGSRVEGLVEGASKTLSGKNSEELANDIKGIAGGAVDVTDLLQQQLGE